jgi:hypothetical protein
MGKGLGARGHREQRFKIDRNDDAYTHSIFLSSEAIQRGNEIIGKEKRVKRTGRIEST